MAYVDLYPEAREPWHPVEQLRDAARGVVHLLLDRPFQLMPAEAPAHMSEHRRPDTVSSTALSDTVDVQRVA